MRSLPKNFIIARRLRAVHAASLFSGGKDSAYATYIAQQTAWTVRHMVTVVPVEGSMMFHHPNVGLAPLLAEAMGIPHVSVGSGEGEGEEVRVALHRHPDDQGLQILDVIDVVDGLILHSDPSLIGLERVFLVGVFEPAEVHGELVDAGELEGEGVGSGGGLHESLVKLGEAVFSLLIANDVEFSEVQTDLLQVEFS